ncbi:MAG: CoA transferase [Candidatus Promineifilaceae bacterium]
MTSLPLLAGVRVIDLTRVLAGPYCTMMLGDLGADVIKIENPESGDDTRHWGPPYTGGEAAYFLSANRNKRSLTLNLKSSQGIHILKELIRQGDVLVENFRTGTLARWGLTYDALQELRPGLIYATITGYGTTGPDADRAGYDFMAQARGGFMSLTGPVTGEPTRAGIAITDLTTGMFACNAILAALVARGRSGEGQYIDMALLDTQVALLSYAASNYLISGNVPQRYGNGHPNIVPYQEFRARDGYFAFACGNDGQWRKFCEAVGRPEWTTDERYATNTARVQHRTEVVALLSELLCTRDKAEWMALCDQIGIPNGPINDVAQVFVDPQVQAREMVITTVHPTVGDLPLVASPMKIPTNPVTVRQAPPLLGQHTAEILGEFLGYDAARIEQLRTEGVI